MEDDGGVDLRKAGWDSTSCDPSLPELLCLSSDSYALEMITEKPDAPATGLGKK